jgi:hypothetical protein
MEVNFLLTADVHGLRELMQQIIAHQDQLTSQDYQKLRQMEKKIDKLLSSS